MYYTLNIEDFLFLSKDSFRNNADAETIAKEDIKEKENPWIFCTICHNKLTKKKDAIEIDSKHSHSFLNPHGVFYNIRCFKNAEGALPYGESTRQFSWFKGYSWQIIVCSKCRIHIGWRYDSGSDVFYGLIENVLTI